MALRIYAWIELAAATKTTASTTATNFHSKLQIENSTGIQSEFWKRERERERENHRHFVWASMEEINREI